MNSDLCPGCGISLPPVEGPVHAYMTSSPACWALYGEVLARDYSEPAFRQHHRLTVDAYAVQHPGTPNRQSIQSVAVHLLSLHAVIERGLPAREATALIKRSCDAPEFASAICWLDPPARRGQLTVESVFGSATVEAHGIAVSAWAQNAWDAWSSHHDTIRRWTRIAG